MDQSYKIRIQNYALKLSSGEKAFNDYIFKYGDKVMQMPISELAKELGYAPSGIVRFCKKLGYKGFSQLKLCLAKNGLPTDEIILPSIKSQDDSDTVIDKVFRSNIKTLQDTLVMLDRNLFYQAIDWIANTERIEFYGVGTSSTIAIDAYYRFMRVGFPAYCATDPMIMRISASHLNNHHIAFGISHSGQTIDTLETMKIAKTRGAKTIVLTSHRDSPICKNADLILPITSDEATYPIEAVSARIAHISLLDAICVALSLRETEHVRTEMLNLNNLMRTMRKCK